MPGIFDKIFASAGGGLLNSVGGLIDKFNLSPADKEKFLAEARNVVIDHDEKMATLAQQQLDSELKDLQQAREANTRIQESANASWISKNFIYFFASAIFLLAGGVIFYLMNKLVPVENKEQINIAFGYILGWVGSVIAFWFHTTASSKVKDETIRKLSG